MSTFCPTPSKNPNKVTPSITSGRNTGAEMLDATHTHTPHVVFNIRVTIRVSGNQMSVTALQAVWGFGQRFNGHKHTYLNY